jgi:hypothetical protein
VAELLSQVADGLVDGGIGAKASETGIHQAAGDVFAKGEKGFHFAFGFVVEEIEKIVPLAFGRFLNEISGIVGSEKTHVEAALAFGERKEQARLGVGVEGEEEIVHEFARESFETIHTLPAAETGPEVEEFVGGIEGMRDHRGSLREGVTRSVAVWRGTTEILSEKLYHCCGAREKGRM